MFSPSLCFLLGFARVCALSVAYRGDVVNRHLLSCVFLNGNGKTSFAGSPYDNRLIFVTLSSGLFPLRRMRPKESFRCDLRSSLVVTAVP